jgi:hypothetical protein
VELKLNLPPFLEVIEKKEDFGHHENRCRESEAAPTFNITAPEPKSPVIAVISGDNEPVIPTPRFDLIVTRTGPTPTAPLALNAWTKVVDVEQFIQATLADLAACIAARNKGGRHWASDLIDEKLESLRVCGIEAEIREVQ